MNTYRGRAEPRRGMDHPGHLRSAGEAPRRAPAVLRILAAVVVVVASCTAIVAATASSGAAASYQDWPMFLQNNARTNATVDPNLSVAKAPTLKPKWAFKTGGPVATSTSVVGTTAYVGSWDGFEYAVNTATGAQIWKSANLGITTDPGCNPSTIGITSSADVVNGVVYVGGGGPNWYALDAATGATLWSVFTGDNTQAGAHYNWSSPLIYNGFAYIGVASNCDNPLVQGQLLQVSLITHQVVNTYNFVPNGQLGGGIWTTPTLDTSTTPATIFATTGTLNDYTQSQSQAIVALNASTLAYEGSWQLPFEAAVSDSDWGTTPTLTTDAQGDQLVTAANKNGIVYTWKRSDLELGHPDPNPPLWQHQIAIGGAGPTAGDGTIASGIFANGTLYYAGGHSELNGHGTGGSIGAYNPGTGATQWVRQTEQPIIGAPAYVNGLMGYGEGNEFEVVNAANGQLLYSYQLPAATYGAVSVARSQFYVGDLNSNLYAFGLNSSTATLPPDPNCPASLNPSNPSAGPVTCQDIRSPGVAGSESTSNGTLTVTASGAAIHGTSDQFRFLSTPVTGDSQSSVQITAQSTQNTQPQAGVMVRQSNDPTAPFYGVFEYPNDLTEGNPLPQIVFWYRTSFGGNSIELTKLYPAVLPQYIMVQRAGNLFSAGVSTDGVHYTLIPGSTADIDMPATTMQGLAVDSGSSTNTGTASFSNLAIGAPVTTTLAPQAPTDPCPAAWTCTDIGNPNPPGDTTSTSPTSFTLDGTGTGIGGGSDSFHYVSQSVTGSQSLSAQVVTQPGSPATAQEGIMMRANLSPTSPYYAVTLKPGGSATISWRYYDGIVDGNTTLPLPAVKSPAYVEIVSYNDTSLNPAQQFFSTETSPDGVNWTPVLGSVQAIPMGTNYLAGMAADAASPRVAPPVVFNAVTIAAANTPPAGICPQDFTCSDLGTNILPGNQTYINPAEPTSPSTTGVWTIKASGSDIWSVFDNFRYEYENFPDDPANSPNGDGTVSARVVSQTGADQWTKTGVMIRGQNGSDPQAPYYGVFVTPSNGVVVQWRPSEGALTNQLLANTGGGNGTLAPVTPIWVLAERYTNTTTGVVYYAAFTSSDGVNWTWVPGSTVPLNLTGFLTSGIATDSHNDAAYSVATVDNLAQFGGSSPPPAVCPNGWSCTDIGGALPPGQDNLSNTGTWSEVGGGGDIWSTADAFHLVNQTLAGDGTVSAHITSQQATDPFAKAGPMLRASTDPGSPYYAAFVTPGNGIAVQWRSAQGGTTSQILAPGSAPLYLRVGRYTSGTQTYYSAYSSPDGVTWTLVPGSTQVLTMTGTLLAGFGITSHAQGTGSAVTLDSVSITPGEVPPPGICPAGWSCTDIGGALPAGQDSYANGTWNEVAGGGDIWGTADGFHFASQSLTGDGAVTAHVTAQQATSPWAKAGVMLRATADPASPYYAAFVTPGNGVAVQWRSAQGGSSSQVLTPGATPIYVRVSRYTTTGTNPATYFIAFTSPDGTNWTVVPGSIQALNLPQPLLGGIAITSHAQGTGGAVTLDTVSVAPGEFPASGLVCPSGFSCADIGAVKPMGGQTSSGSQLTVQGGGPDIWGTADAFHFVWQSLAADGTVSVQIATQQATDPWAKAGVMLRATTDPGSPYYAAYITEGNGIVVQLRTAQGVSATQLVATTGAAPEYLEVVRSGTTYSVATSPDGVTWTPLGGSSLSVPGLSGSLLAGVAVSSHNNTLLSTVGFNALTVTGS